MANYINRLPAVFQTTTEKKFFDATFDQVFSKKDSDLLAGYLGRRDPGEYNPISDFYIPEPTKNRTWWQLESTAYSLDTSGNKSNIFFYEDLLNKIQSLGGNILNQDRLFESKFYSFGPPIDYDMFINYQNYYWIDQYLPTIEITGVTASSIIGQPIFTTPNTATPPGLTLSTGMVISLLDDPDYSSPHLVENFGGCTGIQLVPKFPDFIAGTIFENLPWDGEIELSTGRIIDNRFWDATTWDTETQPGTGDYITIERGARDRNAWSRTNKWFHIDVINKVSELTGTSFPSNATRALRPIIQFIADLVLYKSGTQFRDEIDYGFRDNGIGNPLLFTDFNGKLAATLNSTYGINIVNGTSVVFFNDTTQITEDIHPWDTFNWDTVSWDSGNIETINQFIFIASIDNSGFVTFSPKTSYLTPIVEGDIVFIDADAPYNGALRGETWYYSNGTWQEAFNDKISINQPPLFQLYDHNSIPLDDSTAYPGSNFEGNKIFSYKVDTTPGATVDPVLGFPIIYTSLGQSSDIIFQNNLITDRYIYNNFKNIDGYYYYKKSTKPVLYNSWNLYDLCDCPTIIPTPPCNCIETSKQRVIDKYVVGFGSQYQFKLSATPVGYPGTSTHSPDIIVIVNGIEVKSSSEQTDGYGFVVVNDTVYVDLSIYLTNLLLTQQKQPPVVEIQTYTRDELDPAASGYFQIPQQLEANPSQLEVAEISGSNLIQHFTSIISNQIGFTGTAFGGSNNYRDSRKNRSIGSYILQNVAPILKSMLVSSTDDLDFITAERFSQDEYTKFKNKYISTSAQLINQSFNPVQYHTNSISITYWVDEIIKRLNISKEFSDAFAYSYMIATGTPTFTESHTVAGNSTVLLDNYIDLSDPKNILYVYEDNGSTTELLVIGQDYDIISTNLSIEVELKKGSSVGTFVFYLYQNPLPTYIPSTPTKLGLYNAYIPRKELDTSYAIPTYVIIGHDGSKTIAYGDYRDELLLDLEIRIYNNIQETFRNEYVPSASLVTVKSGYFRKTRYSVNDYLDITESYLNKWSAKNRVNYRINDWPTASTVTPVNELWKLYNYRNAVDTYGNSLNLPGNWKGIYQFYYDTYNPNTRPWEMLGFSEQPSWWIVEYGVPTINGLGELSWTSTSAGLHQMWQDLEDGIIRQGPRAVYDPITLNPVSIHEYARPGLLSIIPVDASGNLIPVPTLFNVAMSGNNYAPFDGFDEDWIYGDGGPVEQAWMSTSGYAFSVQEFIFLTRPGPFGEYSWDTLGTSVSPGTFTIPGIEGPVQSLLNWQYVQNDLYSSTDTFFAWMRPKNKDQNVHAETIDGIIQVRFGYQAWISDRLLFLGKDITDNFGQKVRTLDVNLANKLAGFTNKDTTTNYIESVTPGATTNTLAIPSIDFQVILHKGPPVKTYAYSGVIIRALSDGAFAVYGYDLLNSEFIIQDRSNNQLIDVTVGATPAEFRYFNVGDTYNVGDIVRYNGVYYQSLITQTVTSFVSTNWKKLPGLPNIGGISVSYKPISASTTTKIPYGYVMSTVQEVFDFLIGWGAWLESQGWQFENVNQDTAQVEDWLFSAKQFLFWLNSSWAPDASIQLSPIANSATLIVDTGYPDDVETLNNGVYSILDKYGVAIAPNNTTIDRDGKSITVSPNDVSVGGIYFLQVTASETEHILIFNNTTSFNDIVYSPLLRARQQRLRFNGFRSNGWYGKMEAPGYLVIDNQLVPNYDTIVDNMRYYYDPNLVIDNPSLEELGRHLIGYENKSYLDNLQVSDNIQYLFYQGSIRQKGTKQALEKLFRSTKIQINEIIEIYEEWALKLGNFGNTIEQVSTEFKLTPEQNSGEVIVSRLNFVPSSIGFVKEIRILNAQNIYTSLPVISIAAPDATPDVPWTVFSPSATYAIGDVVKHNDTQGNAVYYSSNVAQGPSSFNSSNWTIILQTRQATAYAVLDTTGVITRVDIVDPGYGYLSAPAVKILVSNVEVVHDKLYSVWQGDIVKDTTLDNIIDIDIDETDVWTVRPPQPSYSLVFPTTSKIEYYTPSAGYVHFNDVDHYSFDIAQTAVNWGISNFNPIEGDSIWVAKNFINDWGVYKLVNISPETFDVWKDGNDELYLRTTQPYLITAQGSTIGDVTDFGNMIVLQVIEAQAEPVIASGSIQSIIVTKTGANYIVPPNVVITGDGTGAQAVAVINGGIVTEINITIPGTGYTTATITIDPPAEISGQDNFAVAFEFDRTQTLAQNDGLNYYSLLTLDGNPITSDNIPDYTNFTKLMLFKTLRFFTTPVVPSYLANTDKIWVDQVGTYPNVLWSVYTYNSPNLVLFRQQEKLIDTSLFENASIYDDNGNELIQLPIYDPYKGILPGPAKQNLTYIIETDPATYNVTPDPRLQSTSITFGPRQVGQLWWDISTSKFVYYEQPKALDNSETDTDNLVYRRDHWAMIAPGSSVDVYEWTESLNPPADYTGTGTPRDTTSFVQIVTANVLTGITEIKYYFWVLNKTDKPNLPNRTLTALDVSLLLQTPKSQGFSFFCPVQQTSTNNSYMFYNVQELLTYKGNNIQIQYRVAQRNDQEHTQWSFFREGDSTSLVTDQYWNKMVDSLCGYTKDLTISSEFGNGIIIDKNFPWNTTISNDPTQYTEILPVPDPMLSDGEKYGISFRPRQGMFIDVYAARKNFVYSANSLLQYIPIRDTNINWNTGISTDIYWKYVNWYKAGYENATPSIIYQQLSEAISALNAGLLQVGQIVEVINGTPDGRYILYVVTQPDPNVSILSLDQVGIENSAIQLLDTVYSSINKYSLSVELRQLLDAFRTTVMIDDYIVDQNELFFSMMNYVLSEQKNVDWMFKSSYIFIKENNLPLTKDTLFIPDQISNIVDFITDSKPYHTNVRDYTSTYTNTDMVSGTSSDNVKITSTVAFGPDFADASVTTQQVLLDAGQITDAVTQYVSGNPTPADFNPGTGNPWPNVYTIELTNYDPSKKGYSELYPYTFSFDSLNINNPQTFITPNNIVAVQIGTTILNYGVDYFVEYNNDSTYTIYFFDDPSVSGTPVALVWWDAGQLLIMNNYEPRGELANGFAEDDFVIGVDTRLPINISTGSRTPYVGWGDVWEAVSSPLADVIIANGGTTDIPWDVPLEALITPITISYRENLYKDASFVRNATVYTGNLVYDLPAPTAETYNLDTITVFVDPADHPNTDILPEPTLITSVIWIQGERIEYRKKELVAPNTWKLSLLVRGSNGTAITDHPALVPTISDPAILKPNLVFVEFENIVTTGTADTDVWNAAGLPASPDLTTEQSVDHYTSIQQVPAGGMWYSRTPEAIFLITDPGAYFPDDPSSASVTETADATDTSIGGRVLSDSVTETTIPTETESAGFGFTITEFASPIDTEDAAYGFDITEPAVADDSFSVTWISTNPIIESVSATDSIIGINYNPNYGFQTTSTGTLSLSNTIWTTASLATNKLGYATGSGTVSQVNIHGRKIYCEFQVTSRPGNFRSFVGVSNNGANPGGSGKMAMYFSSSASSTYSSWPAKGHVTGTTVTSDNTISWGTTDRLSVAVDASGNTIKLWVGSNNVWFNGNPATGTGGLSFNVSGGDRIWLYGGVYSADSTGSMQLQMFPTADLQFYTPPTGFSVYEP
jgi:hypothetical protein